MRKSALVTGVSIVGLVGVGWVLWNGMQSTKHPQTVPAVVAAKSLSSAETPEEKNKVVEARESEGLKNVSPSESETGLQKVFSLRRLMSGDYPKLTREQMSAYMAKNPSSPEAALAAMRRSPMRARGRWGRFK